MRKLIRFLLVGTATGVAVLAVAASAQDGARPPGTVKPEAEINAELDRSNPELGIVAGQITEIIGLESGRIVVRRRQEGPNNASVHNDLTEIYYVVTGAGTFVTGGAIANPEDRTQGTTGGVAQRIEAGDFVILPPGTAHWFSEIEGSITYMETRFDAGP